MLLTVKLRGKLYETLVYFLFVATFMVAYRDVLFLNTPFMGANLIIPTTDINYYINGLFSSWFPGSLGFPSQPGLCSVLHLILTLISGISQILVSKLLLCYMLVAAFSMYFFLSNHFETSHSVRFVASMLFAFSPSIVFDFTDITLWGYAMLPIVFNYMLNLLDDEKIRIRDLIMFSMSLAFTIEFVPQILPVVVLAFFIFLFTRLLALRDRVKYFAVVLKRFIPSSALFLALSFQTIRGVIIFRLGGGGLVPPEIVFFYSEGSFVNTFRVIGGDYLSMIYQYPNALGFALPILAFASLLLVKKRKPFLNLIALSMLTLSILWLAYSIKENLPWVIWLNEHTPLLKPMIAPQRPLYLVSFSYSCMIGVTTHEVIKRLQSVKLTLWRKTRRSYPMLKKTSIAILVSSLILSINFLYSPVFDTYEHGDIYYPLPSSYEEIESWLYTYSNNEHRFLLVPTFYDFPPHLNDFSKGSIGVGQVIGASYVDYIYDAMVRGSTCKIGSLLAPAGVKYVIVNLESPEFGHLVDLIIKNSRSGPIRVEVNTPVGDPLNFMKFLDEQRDLERIATMKNFIVYLNKMQVPHLAVHSDASFILGSMNFLSTIVEFSDFKVNRTLLILGYQNPSQATTLSKASSRIVFFNTDFNELLMLLALPKYGISLSRTGFQQGWMLVPTNSSCFSYGGGYILTDSPQNLTINFETDVKSTYQLWLRVLFTPSVNDLKVLIDNQNLRTFKPYAPSNLGFQWINAGSIDLAPGVHTLKLTSYGFNAIDEAVIIPSAIMQEINVSATNIVRDAKTLFILDFHASTLNVTIPAGEYWIALKQPIPMSVKPIMGLLDFDSTQSFIISRENFKPAHNPPSFDFDNANYYFQTAKGGWVKFSFRGSGLVTIMIHTPDMELGEQRYPQQIPLPMTGVNSVPAIVNNTDIYIQMPAGSTFQPVVYAYNPEMNLNVPNNLSEIVIQYPVEAGSPAFAIDNINITEPAYIIENGTWFQYGPMQLTSGEHKITLYQPFQAHQPIAIYNTANLTDIFSSRDTDIHYNVTKVSESKYYVDVSSDKPVFLALAESYHSNWVAYIEEQQLNHFIASSFANGFYLNKTGTNTLKVEFKPTWQNLVTYAQEVSWAMVGLFLIASPAITIIRRKIKACARLHMRKRKRHVS